MADWFALSNSDQLEALETAASRSGRPTYLIEKDIWVVWALSVLYQSSIAEHLTFKGGTSLSKVYNIIDRFSEDIDLTLNIKQLVGDLLSGNSEFPTTNNQQKKISDAVRARLPDWIANNIHSLILDRAAQQGIEGKIAIEIKDGDKLT